MRYWLQLDEAAQASFDAAAKQVSNLYRRAAVLHQRGVHVVCCDEKTGIQAWSEPLRHDLLSLDLSNSKMLTTSATARARSLPTSKLPLVRSSLQASVPLEMSTTSPTTSAALSL